jgi:hypothetical protein
MIRFKDFIALKKIRVEVPENFEAPLAERLDEATRAKVGNFTARRDPPHFQGDEYHGHAEVPGGYEVAWGRSGTRRHPNKFPAEVPHDAKAAVAKVLGVDVSILECYKVRDDTIQEDVYLIEVKA